MVVYRTGVESDSMPCSAWVVPDKKTYETIDLWSKSALKSGFVNIVTWVPQVYLEGKNFSVIFNNNLTIVNYQSSTFGPLSYSRTPTALDKEIREKLYSYAIKPENRD